jgi:glutamate synthase (NADPH/NADH) large chain
MSGGVAFVYKLRADRVNPDSLANGELDLEPLDDQDAILLRSLLGAHLHATDSLLAKTLLAEFETEKANFTKIVPRDYANVRKIQAKAQSQGIDLDSEQVWLDILAVSNHG